MRQNQPQSKYDGQNSAANRSAVAECLVQERRDIRVKSVTTLITRCFEANDFNLLSVHFHLTYECACERPRRHQVADMRHTKS